MRRFIHSYFPTAIFFLIFIACHSKNQPVAARTNKAGFHETPLKAANMPMHYDTTSAQARDIIARLDDYYRKQVRAGFNGSVLVGVKGKVIYERYFGYGNRESRMMLSPNNPSQLASVSKTFTGAAVLYLYERKYLDINNPVQTYIKNFPYPNITLRMLLNHRSGLPDYTKWYSNYRKDIKTPITNADMVNMIAQYRPALEFRPDSRFKYCNTNYALLARIVEVVTEIPFRDFMTKYFFEPLGMTHTFIYDPAKGMPVNATISYKYNWMREPEMFADGVFGDKSLYSTVEDMYRWDQSFYTNKLLSNNTMELAYGPCSFEKPGVKNYGLGWRMLCYPNGNKIIYHNGWWHGNNTSFYRFIKENMTIVILGNKMNNGIYHQAPVIYSTVKGIPEMKGFDTGEMGSE